MQTLKFGFELSLSRWMKLLVLALVFTLAGLGSLVRAKYSAANLMVTSGTVLRNELVEGRKGTLYCPVIDFQVQGLHQSYEEKVCTLQPLYQPGEAVQVYVDLSRPVEARLKRTEGHYFWVWFYFSFAAALFLLAFYDYYVETEGHFVGTPIKAKVINISGFNDRGQRRTNKFFIEAVWIHPETQRAYEFKSQGLDFDPTPVFKGKEIDLMVDLKDPKKYKFILNFAEKKSA